ncbi:MAG TPA: chromosome segregation protein SMC [Burkholderiales bacterium]|nr:chromosome segregation protein SMC [Burkholderiales bacterium]
MRLTHIKLAGFKSFVDPTHIPVPGQLVGVVGPNGCGKSNVIDAIRWVLGESSAKQLRGEHMQDVIFNGSGERKPTARASVELIFDNSLGKAAGPWSAYSEISVKRVLERDGESSYFLNNQHVRRRDVADIFLGTGLGGRGYAIIEQGMISRIIEAKPEDLRSFLEEAAGVSKYRERRRETELRLEDTRENLLRVDDIRQELGKQLEHLESQAEKAGKFRSFEASLKRTQHLLWMLRRRDAQAQRARIARDVDATGVELEAQTARLRDAEKRVEELRARHYSASDAVHAAQGALYEVNAEIARVEQQVQFLRDSRSRAEQQLRSLRGQQDEQGARRQSLEAARGENARALEAAAGQLDVLREELAAAREALPLAEVAQRDAQARLAEAQDALTRAEQRLQLEDARKAHTERFLQQLASRRARLEEERDGLEVPNLSELVRLEAEIGELERQLAGQRAAFEQCQAALPTLESGLRSAEDGAEQVQQRLHQIDARLTALQSLQDQVSRAGELEPWLDRNDLRRSPHLWQGIRIREGWEDALEAVLRERLNSVGLSDLSQAHAWLSQPPPGKLSFHRIGSGPVASGGQTPPGLERLTDYVTCIDERLAGVLADWLAGVYVLPDLAAGVEIAASLPPGAMLVSAQGHMFTPTSVSFHADDSEVHGILSRQREIEALFEERTRVDTRLTELAGAASAQKSEFEERREQAERLRRQVTELQESQHQLKLDHVRLSQLAERLKARGEQIVGELAEIDAETAREAAQRESADREIAALRASTPDLHEAMARAAAAYAESATGLRASRDAVQSAERQEQEAAYQKKTIENKIIDIDSSFEVVSQTLVRLGSDAAALTEEISRTDEGTFQEQLQRQLEARGEREEALKQARNELDGIEQSLHATEQERLAADQALVPARERLNELRLKEQEARLAEEGYASQLEQAGADQEELLPLLEEGLRASRLQAEINRLNEDIAALGPVNLAALEELSSARERKAYLDSQSQDLTEAVETLETAIRKIDRETRERLQETFDAVNRHFGEMFPALFGGGEAKLVMTGEEILDAGVQVIARPPGKRNSSIHLLSGGEKALTALSLVFSMFQLNPAPFCLLDEVDAPLDDSNTERFCGLVRKMSGNTQFMFITHNKITMEMASQLIGVTMQEQGVSRVVAVDVDEAMRMREEAAA